MDYCYSTSVCFNLFIHLLSEVNIKETQPFLYNGNRVECRNNGISIEK